LSKRDDPRYQPKLNLNTAVDFVSLFLYRVEGNESVQKAISDGHAASLKETGLLPSI